MKSLRYKLKSRTSSLQQIFGRGIEPFELKQAIGAGMAKTLQIDFQPAPLHPHEWALANEIASAKTVLPEKEK